MDIINELRLRGYDAELISYNKNGVNKKGIVIKGTEASPVFDIEQGFTADEIIEYYNRTKSNYEYADLSRCLTAEYIRGHIQVRFVKSDGAYTGLVRQSIYAGLIDELYLDCGNFVIAVSEDILRSVDISAKEAWYAAAKNTMAEIQILSFPLPLLRDEGQMAIISNRSFTYGAACALNKRAIVDFARTHGFNNITLIPSSVNEFLLVDLGKEHYDRILDIVKTVNKEYLTSEEILSNNIYSLN